jgi:hypothetical protein
MSDLSMRVGGEEYVLRHEGGDVRVGRRIGGGSPDDIAWLDDVDPELFSHEALDALDRGNSSDEALLIAVRGIVEAEVERGG